MVLKKLFFRLRCYNQFLFYLPKYPLKICSNHRTTYFNNDLKCFNTFSSASMVNVKHNSVKYSSDTLYSSDSDPESGSEEDFIEMEEHSEFSRSIPIRTILNNDVNDPLINELNSCVSVQEVFDVIDKNENNMDVTHISQAILVLWDLQKCFYKHNMYYCTEGNINKLVQSNALIKNYIDQINNHKDFQKLLNLVENNYEIFSIDALTCSLLYLNRMGVKFNNNMMQKMILKCKEKIIKNKNVPLTALSRFTVAVFSQEDGFWPISVAKDAMTIICSKLDSCETAEDFKLLTICLHKMHRIVTDELLQNYKMIAERLIENNVISSNNYRTILKVIMFLNRPQWKKYNSSTIRKYIYVLKNDIKKLTDRELILLFKIFQIQKEPADMLVEIEESAANRLSQMEDSDTNLEITLDLLSCIVSFSSPLQRPKFESLARRYLKNTLSPPSLTAIYKILYHIKSTDVQLCNNFWDKALEVIQNDNSDTKLTKLLNLCHKYVHFNNDVGRRYRYYKFENSVINFLLHELEFGISGVIPYKFSRIASFIIAYNNDLEVLDIISNKFEEMQTQLSATDILNVSKGLQIAYDNARLLNSTTASKHFAAINTILNNCAENEIFVKKNCSLQNINTLLRGYVFRKGNIQSNLYRTMLDYYLLPENDFSSHILRDLSFTLQYNKSLLPELIDKMADYVIKMNDSILGNTVDKVLNLCYYLGYSPGNGEEFFETAAKLVIRDKERLSGLAYLQASLALCFFQKLPEEIVKHIFSVNFLEKLDEELSHCYSKTTYPTRVRDHMMQLNRAVCIDYPESNVPWFHEKYVQDLKTQDTKRNYFHEKVYLTLVDSTKDKGSVSQNVFSPYGYQIDFEINLENKELQNSISRKIAVLIQKPKAFTYLNKNLKGYYQLKQRHLEILGYEIMYENQLDWRELYTHENCINYITEKIWPSINIKQFPMSR